jgi:hypothetical protein
VVVDAAGAHALVLGVDQHGHAGGAKVIFDRVGDLHGHGLLSLETLGENLDQASQLGQAHDLAGRHVGHPGLAQERRHVVFAVALHVDAAQHHHVVIALHVLEGARKLLGRIAVIAGEPLAIGVDHALGRVEQAFTVGVVAGPGQQGPDGGHGLVSGGALGGFKIKTGVRADQGSLAGQGVHVFQRSFHGLSCAEAPVAPELRVPPVSYTARGAI